AVPSLEYGLGAYAGIRDGLVTRARRKADKVLAQATRWVSGMYSRASAAVFDLPMLATRVLALGMQLQAHVEQLPVGAPPRVAYAARGARGAACAAGTALAGLLGPRLVAGAVQRLVPDAPEPWSRSRLIKEVYLRSYTKEWVTARY